MSRYAFILGRNPELSIAELGAIFEEKLEVAKNSAFAVLKGPLPSRPQEFLNRLGGCVEILEIFEDGVKINQLESVIVNFLKKQMGKILFAVNLIPENKTSRLLKYLLPGVKKHLRADGQSSAFLNKNFQNVNMVAAAKQNLVKDGTNISVIDMGAGNFAVGYTVALQDFEAYSKRDYGKPFRDPQSGMLPPKLAQIMINLAIGLSTPNPKPSTLILDPFCGTGTILMEALLMGYSVIGSDADGHMVEGAKKNIDWLRQIFNIPKTTACEIFQADASSKTYNLQPITYNLFIITEPYLGPPLTSFPAEKFLEKLMKELEDLYVGFFKNLAKRLPKNTPIVFVFPYWKKGSARQIGRAAARLSKYCPAMAGQPYLASPIIAKIESLGYSKTTFAPLKIDSLFYDRPDQIVGREIVRFMKT